MCKTIRRVPQISSAPGWFFHIQLPCNLQLCRKALRNHKARSQALLLNLMMELEDVVCQAEQSPFHLNLDRAAQKKSAEAHVFLGHKSERMCEYPGRSHRWHGRGKKNAIPVTAMSGWEPSHSNNEL